MYDAVQPHRQQPTRLLCPWDSPGKNTGVGCHLPRKNYNYTIELSGNLCQKYVDQIYVGQFVDSSIDLYVYLYMILYSLDSVQFSSVIQLCLTLCNPMDYTVRGILQARILAEVAFPISRGSSQPRNGTQVSCIAGGFFTI